jgi:hypothetical protein
MSAAQKLIWQDCELIAANLSAANHALKLDKHQVFQKLYRAIKNSGHFEAVKANLKEALEGVMLLPEYKALQEHSISSPVRLHKPSKRAASAHHADQLKLAMWFIDKIGSPKQAVRVVQAAVAAIEELNK